MNTHPIPLDIQKLRANADSAGQLLKALPQESKLFDQDERQALDSIGHYALI